MFDLLLVHWAFRAIQHLCLQHLFIIPQRNGYKPKVGEGRLSSFNHAIHGSHPIKPQYSHLKHHFFTAVPSKREITCCANKHLITGEVVYNPISRSSNHLVFAALQGDR